MQQAALSRRERQFDMVMRLLRFGRFLVVRLRKSARSARDFRWLICSGEIPKQFVSISIMQLMRNWQAQWLSQNLRLPQNMVLLFFKLITTTYEWFFRYRERIDLSFVCDYQRDLRENRPFMWNRTDNTLANMPNMISLQAWKYRSTFAPVIWKSGDWA